MQGCCERPDPVQHLVVWKIHQGETGGEDVSYIDTNAHDRGASFLNAGRTREMSAQRDALLLRYPSRPAREDECIDRGRGTHRRHSSQPLASNEDGAIGPQGAPAAWLEPENPARQRVLKQLTWLRKALPLSCRWCPRACNVHMLRDREGGRLTSGHQPPGTFLTATRTFGRAFAPMHCRLPVTIPACASVADLLPLDRLEAYTRQRPVRSRL